ncbi:hypothetical protein DFH27DRAFT_528948 [Peziza echinospora]|nr:hypothetical protein DFH27DRAFT_528948 [Peziza echinospora]
MTVQSVRYCNWVDNLVDAEEKYPRRNTDINMQIYCLSTHLHYLTSLAFSWPFVSPGSCGMAITAELFSKGFATRSTALIKYHTALNILYGIYVLKRENPNVIPKESWVWVNYSAVVLLDEKPLAPLDDPFSTCTQIPGLASRSIWQFLIFMSDFKCTFYVAYVGIHNLRWRADMLSWKSRGTAAQYPKQDIKERFEVMAVAVWRANEGPKKGVTCLRCVQQVGDGNAGVRNDDAQQDLGVERDWRLLCCRCRWTGSRSTGKKREGLAEAAADRGSIRDVPVDHVTCNADRIALTRAHQKAAFTGLFRHAPAVLFQPKQRRADIAIARLWKRKRAVGAMAHNAGPPAHGLPHRHPVPARKLEDLIVPTQPGPHSLAKLFLSP